VFQHVLEEVFLTPSSEHPRRDPFQAIEVVGGQDAGLMTATIAMTDFAYP
jgi:hypothetical protein